MKPKTKSGNVKRLFNILLLFTSLSCFSQITYYDINPDTTISADSGYFDLNLINDDSVEFQIYLRRYSSTNSVHVRILRTNCFVSSYIFEGCYEAIRFNLDDTLSDSGGWRDHPDYKMATNGSTHCTSGMFMGKYDAYLGLKWIDNGIPFYCWVRVDVADDASWFTVKDYAYGPYTVIAGRQTSTYLNESVAEIYFQVYRNDNNIIVKAKNGVNLKQIKLLNLLSQEFPIIMQNNEVIIDNQKFSPGLYLLYLSTDQGTRTIKILII